MTQVSMLRDRLDKLLDKFSELERENQTLRERASALEHQIDVLEQELSKVV